MITHFPKDSAQSYREWCRAAAGMGSDQSPSSQIRELIGDALGNAEVRDALIRNSVGSEAWAEVVPQVLWRGEEREFVIMSPEAYIRVAREGGRDGKGGALGSGELRGKTILVESDVQLGGWASGNEGVWHLPEAFIRGNLEVINAPQIESINCTVAGWLTVTGCPNLKQVSGEVFGVASFTECPIPMLGADFRCAGNIIAGSCRGLEVLNCEAGGGVTLTHCGIRRTGPAFFCGGTARFTNCTDLGTLAGRVREEVRIEISGAQEGCMRSAGRIMKVDATRLETVLIHSPPEDMCQVSRGKGGGVDSGPKKPAYLGNAPKIGKGSGCAKSARHSGDSGKFPRMGGRSR